MAKFLISEKRAINLDNVEEIMISSHNYLKIITDGGLNAREISFVYGASEEIEMLFNEIMEFLASENKIFNCDKFLKTLKK